MSQCVSVPCLDPIPNFSHTTLPSLHTTVSPSPWHLKHILFQAELRFHYKNDWRKGLNDMDTYYDVNNIVFFFHLKKCKVRCIKWYKKNNKEKCWIYFMYNQLKWVFPRLKWQSVKSAVSPPVDYTPHSLEIHRHQYLSLTLPLSLPPSFSLLTLAH